MCKSQDGEEAQHGNERLEFLGDAVLGLLISEYLYKRFADKSEGYMSKFRSCLVSRQILIRVAETLGLKDRVLSLYPTEMQAEKYSSILADAVEALMGALYIDRGYAVLRKSMLPYFLPYLDKIITGEDLKDYKSILQIHIQKTYNTLPTYKCIKTEGADHEKEFTVILQFDRGGSLYTSEACRGKSKKIAEQRVAQMLCQEFSLDLNYYREPLKNPSVDFLETKTRTKSGFFSIFGGSPQK